MTVPCPRCGLPADVVERPEAAMQAGDTTVRVQGLAAVRCPAGHASALPVDATPRAIASVAEMLLVSRVRGVVRRRAVCGACEADLTLPARTSDRPVSLDVDGRVLTLVVECPMVRCPDCGREQLPAYVGEALPDLVAATVASAE